uniref:Protein MEMO1 n=1 Tax=Rhodosorus marinus TaxID=101924 RepID=A0A7S3EE39_9RHOD|mmetsp:Transcript_28757/g.112164  ORF Transcript_28757/g.112164 Transcript_28757/m.112164 type:complete len:299 (+) Transcript_28757:184-1080(+)
MKRVRRASHAGSWYSGDREHLTTQLAHWMQNAGDVGFQHNLRAVIAPHAGYSYSGPTAGYAYAAIDPTKYDRVIVLGPSHHVYLDHCCVTAQKYLETPVGTLKVDEEFNTELKASGLFQSMDRSVDEDEHSIEMHLPYVAHVFRDHLNRIKVGTVLVGSLSQEGDEKYGLFFSSYLSNPKNLFIVSSDFCHWGKRFRYVKYDSARGEIHQSIEHLDRKAIHIIERQQPAEFHSYLRETGNTICGRHPITVLLFAAQECRRSQSKSFSFSLAKYAQSSQCRSQSDSSVSYVSMHLKLEG